MDHKVMTCIDADKTNPKGLLKLGANYIVNESGLDMNYCSVTIDGVFHDLLKSRFAPVDSAFAQSVKRWVNGEQGSESAGEDIQDTKRYALKSDKQLMQVMREDLLSDDEFRGAMKFNIFKYGVRYPEKNGVKDLEKARVYIDELIDFEKEKENENV